MLTRSVVPVAVLLLGGAVVQQGVAQSFRTVSASRLLGDEQSLEVDVQFGVGKLTVQPGTGRALYRTSVHYMEEKFRAITSYNHQSRRLRVGVEKRGGFPNIGTFKTPQLLDLSLTPAVPIELRADVGAAEARIELGGLSVRSVEIKAGAADATVSFDRPNLIECSEFDIKTGAAEFHADGLGNARCAKISFSGGAGDITLDFTGEWMAGSKMEGDVKLTFGALQLRLPRQVGVTVSVDRLLASFDEAGFTRRGTQYVSQGYERATATLALSIKAVVGDIDVVWIDR